MTQHQLIHVLIKAIGLAAIVFALPNFILGTTSAISHLFSKGEPAASPLMLMGWSAVDAAITLCVGTIVIRRSKTIASWLFPEVQPKA